MRESIFEGNHPHPDPLPSRERGKEKKNQEIGKEKESRNSLFSSFPKSSIGNPKVFTEGGFFSLSGLLFFYVFCFFGGYEGESFSPPYCLDP